MQTLLAGVASALRATGVVAMAQKSTVSFAGLDRDGDSRISIAEATAMRKLNRAFPRIDVDRDDPISEREFLN